uniref:peroxidase family protein n=1 Tax=Methylobacterium segetis TaxID=2488750 RepID=UPI00247ABACF
MATQNPNFTVNQDDLAYILKQIVIAERETAGETLQQIIGPNAAILPWGLRHVDGSNNNLLPGGQFVGAADQILPRLLDPNFLNDQDGDTMPFAPGMAVDNTDYGSVGSPSLPTVNGGHTGNVADADPRIISNLIVDMSVNNPAAIAAWFGNPLAVAAWEAAHPGKTAVAPPKPGETLGANEIVLTNEDLSVIPNQSPDIGLSPQFNGWMTFFGQFFDHGLDLITKGNNGTVYIPLQKDDPLYVENSHTNFMALTRSTPVAGPGADGVMGTADDTNHETVNTTTPWIDQNQTYTSHPSHQVFLREYMFSVDSDGDGVNDSHAVSTGRLLDGANGSIATWADTKAQALRMLGIKLDDYDVLDVPLLRTDAYGNFIPGANGYAQIATPDGFVEGTADGISVPANALRTGHAFLNDIAHHAEPVMVDHDHNPATPAIRQTADLDDGIVDDGNALTYDNEMLDSHFVTGDGRGNENIGLTAVHTIFHSEHNRLVEANKQTILASAANGDVSFLNEWLVNDVTSVPADTSKLVWDGERLFQAAKFVTEMQYQHLVFEEFARKVQPAVNPFVFTNTPDINPAITAEFAHVVYRFGHSMLTDKIDRLDLNMSASDIELFDAFLNPQAFTASGLTAAEATGAIVRGMSRQAGNEIDEFVVSSLRNTLLGLPLDLAALNIARGREAGVPAFNVARAQFYEDTGNIDLKPYDNWLALAQNLKNPLSIVNFVAAYGTHPLLQAETTIEGKRAAALALVIGSQETVLGDPTTPADDRVINGAAVDDRLDFLNSTGAWAGHESGLNLVDLWIGGLAERKTEFGGMLGSTFNYVFENQMENLQNGDRLYYLSRLQGLNLLNELEANTFSALAMRNSDLGDTTSSHVAGNLFDTPDLTLEIDQTKQIDTDPVQANAILQAIDPKVTRHAPGADVNNDGHADGGYIRFSGGEHVVLGGTEGNDTLIGDRGIDTLWGDGGDDYLNAQTESDQVFGGDGDDIIVDPFGDNFLRGDA